MNRLNDLVEFWAGWLIHSGWQAAVVVVAIAVLLAITRRTSAQFRYALLVIALAKFASPPFLSLPVGLFSQSRSPIAAEFEVELHAPNAIRSSDERSVDLPLAREATATAPTGPSLIVNSEVAHNASALSERGVAPPKFDWLVIGFLLIYAAGVIGAAVAFRRQYQLIHDRVRNSAPADEVLVGLTRKTAALLGIKSVPPILVSDETDAPFATGLLKQVILLPRSMLELPMDQLQIIIGHELVHIRRNDLTVGWAEAVLSIVWWFHPGMWWLKRELRRTREDCCDDVLLATRLAVPERYCETLIQAAVCHTFRPLEPVALGISNGEHPAARRIRRLMDSSMFRTRRLKLTALLVAMAISLMVLPGTRPQRAPITRTSLETWFGWQNLPFDPAEDEVAIIKECRQVVNLFRSTYATGANRGNVAVMARRFDDSATKDVLEVILERKPDFFYAQHLLGTWHRRNGDLATGQKLLSAALKNSPIVLTQRYRTGTGKPLTNLTIETMAIECNRVKNRSLNPELQLEFVDLVTDRQGEVAVPVYDTVYRLYSRSFPEGYDTEMPRLGWFRSTSRIGELPAITTWKKYSRPNDFVRTPAESFWLSDAKGTTTSEMTSGPNQFQIGRVARCQVDGNYAERTSESSPELPKLPHITNAKYMDHAIVDLTSPVPDRFDIVTVMALDSKTKIPLSSFQSAAGVKVSDKTRFHLYSLNDKLPDEVDLVMTVRNYPADAFRMTIPVAAKGVYEKDGVTFVNEYLGAGEHQGWSSHDGFFQEAMKQDYCSEMLFKISPSNRRFSLLLVTKNGQRIVLRAHSPLVHIPRPLAEIDHFELNPDVPEATIYFEKLVLPPRNEQISRMLPLVEFPLKGLPETVTTDLFAPIVLRCTTRKGNFNINGSFSNEFGWGFNDMDPDKRDPELKSTVVIEGAVPSGIRLSTVFSARSKPDKLQSIEGTGMSGAWGRMQSSGFAVLLSELTSVTVRLDLELPIP